MSNSDNSPAASTRSTSKTNSPTATGAHPFEIRTYTTPNPNVLHPSKFLDPNILDKLKKTMCPVCNNGCEEMSVCCEQCQQWFHATCVKMSQTTYRAISGKNNIKWFCTACLDRKNYPPPAPTTTSNKEDQTMLHFTAMMERMSQLMDRMDVMERNIVTKDSLMEFEKKVDHMIDSKIDTAMEERLEREKRKLHLVFVNVQESTGDKEEIMERDLKKVKDMIKICVPKEAEKIKVEDPTRLGALNAGHRPRLLRVKVENEEIKWQILKNASKLNEGMDWSEASRMQYINLDYTAKEREQNKMLREELKRRRQAGERNIKIKGNKIVTFDPTQ